MASNQHKYFNVSLWVISLIYLLLYIACLPNKSVFHYPVIIDVLVYLYAYVFYINKYRSNNILSFEVLAFPIAFIGIFFQALIMPLVDFSMFHFMDNDFYAYKSKTLQMLAWLVLLLGCIRGNNIGLRKTANYDEKSSVDYSGFNIFIYVLSFIILILIFYDYRSGVFSSWFYYANADWMDVDDRNVGIGHLTCLLNAAAIVDIVRLRQKGVCDLRSYLKKCNKLFVAEWLLVSALLFISGNRNEMLLIVMPLFVAYTICIQKVSNRLIVYALAAGALMMVIIGITRQGVSIEGGALSLLSFTRDFAASCYNTEYLIFYTDTHSPTYFVEMPSYFLSGIPMIGPKLIESLNLKGTIASAVLTTDAAGTHSGMGTALVGDLYYSAGAIWVILFMFILGYIMSRLYHSNKEIGIYKLAFYSYMVSNSVYYVRSAWAFPITIVEYIFVILFIGSIVFSKRIKQ